MNEVGNNMTICVDWANGEAYTGVTVVDANKILAARKYAEYKTMSDGVHRVYLGGTKRFVQWFNSDTEELENVPEVALCDEVFIHDEPDFDKARHLIDLLEVGEACVVEEDMCIIMRVK